MDLIYTNTDKEDIDSFTDAVDFETGDDSTTNDFEITSTLLKKHYWLYIPGTEWGGRVEYTEIMNDETTPTWRGHTFRGLLMQDIIEPLSGNDYRVVEGEANAILKELLKDVLGGFFVVPDTDSGLTISSYQFPLYVKVGTGIMDMLRKYGYRLKIHAEKPAGGEPFLVYAEAVQNQKIIGHFNKDSRVPIRFIDDEMGINHLVCMGSGELQNRQRIDLYLQPDGTITTTQYYTGFEERTAYYDYKNAQSITDLEDNGRKRLAEIASGESLQLYLSDEEYEIGDIIAASDTEHGLSVEKAVIGKILRKTGDIEEIEHKIEGSD